MLEGRERLRGKGRDRVRARVRARVREDAACLTVLPDAAHTCMPSVICPCLHVIPWLKVIELVELLTYLLTVASRLLLRRHRRTFHILRRGSFSRGRIPRIHLHSVSTYERNLLRELPILIYSGDIVP